jgi:uncharacterized protein
MPNYIYKHFRREGVNFMKNNQALETAAMVLVIVGALNWGLVGLGGFMGANWNLVNMFLGTWPQLEWLVYILVGLSGVWALWAWYAKMGKKR